MTQINRQGLKQVLSLFPEQSLAVRELFLRDEGFRGLCEDYALACDTLVRFEVLPDADQRPEIPDYRSVISELEKEIATVLYDTLDNSRQADAANQKNVIPRRPE